MHSEVCVDQSIYVLNPCLSCTFNQYQSTYVGTDELQLKLSHETTFHNAP